MTDEIQEPEGIEHFTPDTPVCCIYHLTGGTKTGCDWTGIFKELTVEIGAKEDGTKIYIRCCPKCECPFVISNTELRELGTIKPH